MLQPSLVHEGAHHRGLGKPNGDQNHPDLAKLTPTLGGFHALMSFVGGIGCTMKNPGGAVDLDELLVVSRDLARGLSVS